MPAFLTTPLKIAEASLSAGAWATIDLASDSDYEGGTAPTLPSNMTGAIIQFIPVGAVSRFVGLQDKSYAGTGADTTGDLYGDNQCEMITKTTHTTGAHECEIYVENVTAFDVNFVGYFTTDATWKSSWLDVTPGTADTWTATTMTGAQSGDVLAILRHMASARSSAAGSRHASSSHTENNTTSGPGPTGHVVPLDGSDQVDLFADDTSDKWYLVGFIDDTGAENLCLSGNSYDGLDKSISSTGSYARIDMSGDSPPTDAVGIVVHVHGAATHKEFALRRYGDTGYDPYEDTRGHGGCYCVPLTDSGHGTPWSAEGKISDVEIDFFVWGWLLNPDAGGVVNFSATTAGVTTTAAAAIDIERKLAAILAGATTTAAAALPISREYAALSAGTTTTAAAVLDIVKNFAAIVSGATTTAAAIVTIDRALQAAIDGGTVTAAGSLAVSRALQAAIDGATTTGTAQAAIERPLTAAIDGTTTTAAAVLGNVLQFAALAGGVFSTGTAALAIERSLQAAVSAGSLTADAALAISRALQAAIAAQTTTAAATLDLAGEVLFSAIIGAVTTTAAADAAIARSLTAAIDAQTTTAAAVLDIAGIIEFAAIVSGAVATGAPALDIAREFQAAVAAQTVTADAAVAVARALQAAIDGTTTTAAATLEIEAVINFLATISANTTTGAAALQITREFQAAISAGLTTEAAVLTAVRNLTASIDAATLTAAANLLTGLILYITDPTIESKTPVKTIATKTPERTVKPV